MNAHLPWQTRNGTITGEPLTPIDMLKRLRQDFIAELNRNGTLEPHERQYKRELIVMIDRVLRRGEQ